MAAKGDAKDAFDLDEDLFSFPVVEMTLEGVKEVKPTTATPMEAAKPAAAEPARAPDAAAPERAAAATDPATVAAEEAVAKASALVEHIERVAPELLEVERAPAKRAEPARAGRPLLALVGAAVAANVLVAALFWNATTTMGAGVERMREELARNAERIAEQNKHLALQGERLAELDARRAAAPEALAERAPTLEEPDAAALRLAKEELALGRHGEARARLSRLLARIDSLDAARRPEVEAEALYLVAESWQAQADAKGGGVR
jgi:hypothetical protein